MGIFIVNMCFFPEYGEISSSEILATTYQTKLHSAEDYYSALSWHFLLSEINYVLHCSTLRHRSKMQSERTMQLRICLSTASGSHISRNWYEFFILNEWFRFSLQASEWVSETVNECMSEPMGGRMSGRVTDRGESRNRAKQRASEPVSVWMSD